jgi:hypothetical protein
MSVPQPKFKIGDLVHAPRVGWGTKEVPCADCLGKKTWSVTTPAGETFEADCNTCSHGFYGSRGFTEEWGDHLKIELLTVGSVRIDTADEERPISYMCRETGVGSGSIYDEAHLFATREEAEVWGAGEVERVRAYRQAEHAAQNARNKKKSIRKPTKKEA